MAVGVSLRRFSHVCLATLGAEWFLFCVHSVSVVSLHAEVRLLCGSCVACLGAVVRVPDMQQKTPESVAFVPSIPLSFSGRFFSPLRVVLLCFLPRFCCGTVCLCVVLPGPSVTQRRIPWSRWNRCHRDDFCCCGVNAPRLSRPRCCAAPIF